MSALNRVMLPTGGLWAAVLGLCACSAAGRGAPTGHQPKQTVKLSNHFRNLRLSEDDRRDLLALSRRAHAGPIDEVILRSTYHPMDIPAALVRFRPRALGAHRFRRAHLWAFNDRWTARRDVPWRCRSPGVLRVGHWCTDRQHIRRATALRFDWHGETLFIAMRGDLASHAEIRDLLERIERRRFEGDIVNAPVVDIASVTQITKRTDDQGYPIYEVVHSDASYRGDVLVFRKERNKLRLLDSRSWIS